jgi:dCMP deaminase
MRQIKSWDEVFMDMAFATRQRSKDPSTNVGAVLVSSLNVVLGTGFNGPPRQLDDNLVPWESRPDKYGYIIHAEENALWYSLGSHGLQSLIGSKLYCTHIPCSECVLRAIRSDVAEIIYPENSEDYPLRKLLEGMNSQMLIDKQKYPKNDN